jgi:hypothetical protein
MFIAAPGFAQVKAPTSKKTAWEKNGIALCDSQGRSTKQNAKVACLDDGSSVVVWEDSRN